MAILLSASDLGFITSSTEVAASDESICIDGIEFPKYIPEPVFEEESSMHFASDQAEQSDLVKALIPSKDTPSHCILFARSHIPEPDNFLSANQCTPSECKEEISRLRKQLNKLKQTKRLSGLTNLSEVTEQIDDILKRIIQYQLMLVTHSEDCQSPRANEAFMAEIHRFINDMNASSTSLENGAHSQQIDDDIEVLNQLLESYNDCPSYDNMVELERAYHEKVQIYLQSFVCLK